MPQQPLPGGEVNCLVIAVDIVDPAAVRLHIRCAECIQRSNGLAERAAACKNVSALRASQQRDRIAAAVCRRKRSLGSVQPMRRIGLKEDAVDGLERHGRTVQVHKLDQRIARGVNCRLFGRERFFFSSQH